MISTISVRKVKKFKIDNGDNYIEVSKANVPLGNIRKTNSTFPISGMIFEVYNCNFSKDITDDITVFIEELEDYKEIHNYKKPFSFKIYYCEKKNILFSTSPSNVTKSFFKALENTEHFEVDYSCLHLDFKRISDRLNTTKGVRFSSNDTGVNAKALSGYEVDANPEANSAIENDDATQIIGVIEVGKKDYTIMLTQSGSIVSYSKLFDYEEKEEPMLSFSIDLLNELNLI